MAQPVKTNVSLLACLPCPVLPLNPSLLKPPLVMLTGPRLP